MNPDAATTLFERYVAAVLAGRVDDPLVVLVDQRVGDPDFHAHVRLFVEALRLDEQPFTLDSHHGLRDAILGLLR